MIDRKSTGELQVKGRLVKGKYTLCHSVVEIVCVYCVKRVPVLIRRIEIHLLGMV